MHLILETWRYLTIRLAWFQNIPFEIFIYSATAILVLGAPVYIQIDDDLWLLLIVLMGLISTTASLAHNQAMVWRSFQLPQYVTWPTVFCCDIIEEIISISIEFSFGHVL